MSLFIIALVQLLLVLGSEAKIYAWGVNDYGQLGLNNTVTMYYKYPQAIPMYNNVDIVDVKASGTFHMATAANGDVYVCGNNWYGALMVPPSEHIFISFPTINPDLKDCKIYLGRRHGNAVCGSKFYGWGASAGYVAGFTGGIYGKKMESLSQYGIGDNVASVVAGSGFAIVTMQNGTVFSVGKGESGELGLGDTKEKLAFTKLTFVDMIPFKKIFPSHADHVCAITANYNLYCWGSNAVGQLGVGDLVDRSSPAIVSFFETDHFVVEVSLGATHTLALTASGRVFSWGLGTHGALGNSRADNATFPSPIEITQLADKNIVQIVAGLNFNYARTSSNQWYSWGAGSGGVLGSQNDADIHVPTLVAFTKSFSINNIYTTSTSRSVYGWMDPSAPTNVSVPELINECLQPGLIECKANAHCVDTDRSAICACDKGFTGSADDCKDIDECAANPCVFSNLCANTPGSYSCSCPPDRPVGDGLIDGSGCKTVPVTFPPTQAPTPSPTPNPVPTPSPTPKSATSSSPAQSTTGASEQTSTGDSVTIATATTASASGNGSSVSSTGGPAPGSTASGSGTSGADIGDNGGSTTNGNSGSTTGDVIGSTTSRTNYYQTLGGVKDLDRIFDQSGSEEDPGIKDPTDKASANSDKDRDVLIGVAVLFGVLIVAALIVIVILYGRSRPPRY